MTRPARRARGPLGEMWAYLRVRKRWWLLPALVVLGLMATFIVLAEGSVALPFVYTLF